MDKNIEIASKIVDLKILLDRCCEGRNKEFGLFLTTYQILFLVSKNDHIAPKFIMEKLGIAKSNLAIATRSLIKDGYVIKEVDTLNRRQIYYSITDAGRSFLNQKLHQ